MNLRVNTTYAGRVVVLPFEISAPMTETLEWHTDLIISQDGSEEAAQLRNAPRQSFDMTVPIHEKKSLGFNMLYGGLRDTWAVPLWFQSQDIASVSAGVTNIPAVTVFSDFRDESLALLWKSEDEWELIEVLFVGVGELRLLAPLQSSFTNAKLMPVRAGKITPSAQRSINAAMSVLQIHFESDANAEIDLFSGESSYIDQFNGFDLRFDCPIINGFSNDQIMTRLDLVDGTLGLVSRFSPWVHNRKLRLHKTVLSGAQEAWEFRQWLHRRSGRYKAFWWPSFEDDLTVLSIGSIGTTMNVRDDGWADFSNNRNAILIEQNDGTKTPVLVASITQLGNDILQLGFYSSLGINAADILRISYLNLVRLESDRVEMLHGGAGRVTCEVMTTEVSYGTGAVIGEDINALLWSADETSTILWGSDAASPILWS